MTLPAALRAILACPTCHGTLEDVDQGQALACPACRVKYPVRDGIPVMLRAEAVAWNGEVS